MPIPPETIAELRDEFPAAVAGLKDSSADLNTARAFGAAFPDLTIFNGTDSLFSAALAAGASGCITALANVASPLLRQVWDGRDTETGVQAQARLTAAKTVLGRYPAAPALKHLLEIWHGFPQWGVRPPLLPLDAATGERLEREMQAALGGR